MATCLVVSNRARARTHTHIHTESGRALTVQAIMEVLFSELNNGSSTF